MAKVKGLTTSGNAGKVSKVVRKDDHYEATRGRAVVTLLAVKDLCALLLGHDGPKCSKCKRIRGLLRSVLAGNDERYTAWRFDANADSTKELCKAILAAFGKDAGN